MTYQPVGRNVFSVANALPFVPGTTLLSVVVPVKDEEAAITPFLARVCPLLDEIAGHDQWEILFVDDGSSDRTLATLLQERSANPGVRILSLSRNFGKEAALSAGIDHARGQAVVPLDVDLQDPPEMLREMVARWREGYEVVYGVRRCRDSDGAVKRITANLFYSIHNALSPDRIPEHAGDFRLIDRRVVDVIKSLPERNRFMKGLFSWSGFRQIGVEYDRVERAAGRSKFSYWKLWTLAIDGITSSSTIPIRVWSYVGALIAVAAFIYAAIIVTRTMIFGSDVDGYPSLLVAVLFMGSIQLISLGVLGEYVGRVLVETKQRPIYVIGQSYGIDD